MTVKDLVFVGLRGYVVALDRNTGDLVWSNDRLKSGYTTVLLDGDRLVVSTNGYIYCLDPLSGDILWENPLKGYGVGIASLVSARGHSLQEVLLHTAAADEAAAHSNPHTTAT